MRRCRFALFSFGLVFACLSTLHSEDKQEAPRIAVAVPLAVSPNGTTKLIVRGWKLNRDIEARTTIANVGLRVIKHENASVPNGQDSKLVGDSQVELEVTIPPEISIETLPITLAAGGAESTIYSLLVGGRYPVVAEFEPNDSFRQAQPIVVPQIVDGQIHADRNVDIYSFELAEVRRVMVAVIARREGSGLDSLLTLFDNKKEIIATSDDAELTDSKIEVSLAAGKYFIVVQDAQDHGGPASPYRLVIGY
jgi:hypothetical protein